MKVEPWTEVCYTVVQSVEMMTPGPDEPVGDPKVVGLVILLLKG